MTQHSSAEFKIEFRAQEIAPHPISASYRFALFAVTIGLLTLPVLYVGIIAAVAYGVYYHLRYDLGRAMGISGLPGLVVYFGPAIIGSALVWFMLRPLFVRKVSAPQPYEVTADSEPVLFQLIEGVCALVRAPSPKHVFIDWRPNASASLDHGIRGFIRRELNLTIGLPLVGRLSIGELGGVIAHEFAHFSQGAGMRLSLLIRSLNNWLSRVAFQPAVVEQKIAQRIGRGGLYGGIVVLGTRVAIWITRRVLHGILLLSHAMSCTFMRQMEYDADLQEAQVAGKRAFASVFSALEALDDGWTRAMELLDRIARRGKSPEDFIAFLNQRAAVAEEYKGWTLLETVDRPGWFRTHPTPSQRIKHVDHVSDQPALCDQRPARLLLTGFDDLSRKITDSFYSYIGLPGEKVRRVSLEEFCVGETLTSKEGDSLRQFFGNRVSIDRPPGDSLCSLADAETFSEVSEEAWETIFGRTAQSFERYLLARQRRATCLRAKALLDARIRFRPACFFLQTRSRREVEAGLIKASEEIYEADQKLREFDKVAWGRLATALRRSKKDDEQDFLVREAWAKIESLNRILLLVPATQDRFLGLIEILNTGKNTSSRRKAGRVATDLAGSLRTELNRLEEKMKAEGSVINDQDLAQMIQQVRATKMPPENQIAWETSECLGLLQRKYFQSLAQLCGIAYEASTAGAVS